MPVYVYRVRPEQAGCVRCQETFEVRQGMADPRLTVCPECGSEVQRIIASVPYVRGGVFGEGLSRERLKRSGLRKLVKTDDGSYRDDTPK